MGRGRDRWVGRACGDGVGGWVGQGQCGVTILGVGQESGDGGGHGGGKGGDGGGGSGSGKGGCSGGGDSSEGGMVRAIG